MTLRAKIECGIIRCPSALPAPSAPVPRLESVCSHTLPVTFSVRERPGLDERLYRLESVAACAVDASESGLQGPMQPCGKKRVFEPVADVHAVFVFAHDAAIIEGAERSGRRGTCHGVAREDLSGA
jgi:hypothetical protein